MANTTSPSGSSDPGGRVYCSEQNPDEPLWGTADTVDVWLCLEYRPAWKGRALTDNALTGRTREWLTRTVEATAALGLRARPQFVRQPRYDSPDTRLLVTLADRTFLYSGRGYDFLQELDLAGELDATGTVGSGALELTEPQYLVCTNGQRDLCCARFGLPLYAEIADRVGERAWQVTHLGGHRFAPNVLTLPDARLYGRVIPESVDEFIGIVEAGGTDFARLRGRTCYPPIVQAAEAAIGRQDLRLLHVDGTPDAARVAFVDARERITVDMRRTAAPFDVVKSCGDESGPVYPFIRV